MPRYFGPCGEIIINIAGAGEGFIADDIGGTFILPSGASGDIITLTPPAGKRVRLDMLNSTNDEAGITITTTTDTVINSLTLASKVQAMAAGEFMIGESWASAGVSGGSSAPYILTKNSNDTIVISKDAGSTSQSIYYSYSYGD
jgi:hypothetical protein